MPTIQDDAICIRRWDFSETSQTVGLFAREHGVLRGLAKGAKRERGSFSGGLDVLTRGQVVAVVKPGGTLATLTQWSLQELYRPARYNLAANRAALYMADLVHHMLSEADPHPALFDALDTALLQLSATELIGSATLTFQWRLLRETGYRPELDRDAGTGQPLDSRKPALLFSPFEGGIIGKHAPGEARGWLVRRETIELLREVERTGDVATETTPATTIERANRLLAAYIRELLGTEPHSLSWAFPDLIAPHREDR